MITFVLHKVDFKQYIIKYFQFSLISLTCTQNIAFKFSNDKNYFVFRPTELQATSQEILPRKSHLEKL